MMETKFAIRYESYDKVAEADKEAIGELIVPYPGQYKALQIIQTKGKRYRIVFDLMTIFFQDSDKTRLIKEWNELMAVDANIALRIDKIDYELMKECKNVFLDAFMFSATTPQEAKAMFNAGVREVYVTGSLAADFYALKKLRQIMKLRMIPNYVQSDGPHIGNPYNVDPLMCFWVRPEAWELYDGIINVMEFNYSDRHKEEGLLSIYRKKQWTGMLGDVIIDTTGKLDTIKNDYRVIYDKMRMSCGLRCVKDESCHGCQNMHIEQVIREAEKKN